MIDHDLAAELDALAEAIARLKPISARNPHAFHEERSELASRARALALQARIGDPIGPADVPGPIGRQVMRREVRHIAGRTVLVLSRSACGQSTLSPG